MQSKHQPELVTLMSGFAVDGPIGPVEPLGNGLINQSFRVRACGGEWVLQRINGEVFPYPERIMANLGLLAGLRDEALRLGLRVPALVASRTGAPYVRDASGAYWRLMELIPDTISLKRLETVQQAFEVGSVLGRFHRLAAQLPPDGLQVSLPGFHHAPTYHVRYLAARVYATNAGDAERGALEACFAQIDARRWLVQALEDARAEGRIRDRVIHGDPKLDNILFDAAGRRALALIDLDTVQPGLIQQDLGDCLRSCCNRMGESAEGRTPPQFDLDLCAAILQGYAQQTRELLTTADIDVLYDSIRLLPFELALRFLTDHLEEDRYFRVAYRGENLERARIQLDLLGDIESKESAIRRLVAEVFRSDQ